MIQHCGERTSPRHTAISAEIIAVWAPDAAQIDAELLAYGSGLFGSVDRWQQAGVLIAVWGIQLWWSPPLLRRFRYGPLEWSWRALTYWRVPGR